jgi:hypothetical protein
MKSPVRHRAKSQLYNTDTDFPDFVKTFFNKEL